MDEWTSALRTFGEFGGAVTFAGSLLALLFRERLISTLTSRTARALEERKGELQRELEAYKVGLIAEAERSKSAAEVRKSAALKMMSLKLERLTEYFVKNNEVLTWIAAEVAHRTPATYAKCLERLSLVKGYFEQVSPFLSPAQNISCIQAWQALSTLVTAHANMNQPPFDPDSPLYVAARQAHLTVQALLRQQIEDLSAI